MNDCIYQPYNILFYNNILNNKGIFSLTPFNQTNTTNATNAINATNTINAIQCLPAARQPPLTFQPKEA